MAPKNWLIETPDWVQELISYEPRTPEQLMDLAIDIASRSVDTGGGPFGSVIATSSGKLIDVGWNSVIPSCDSTAHAETLAIRRAQRKTKTHDLAATGEGPLVLYTSLSPCIQCFGVIYWSKLAKVYSAASKTLAESIGFDEGPTSPELWAIAGKRRGIEYTPNFHAERAAAPLKRYQEIGGIIY